MKSFWINGKCYIQWLAPWEELKRRDRRIVRTTAEFGVMQPKAEESWWRTTHTEKQELRMGRLSPQHAQEKQFSTCIGPLEITFFLFKIIEIVIVYSASHWAPINCTCYQTTAILNCLLDQHSQIVVFVTSVLFWITIDLINNMICIYKFCLMWFLYHCYLKFATIADHATINSQWCHYLLYFECNILILHGKEYRWPHLLL